MTRGAWIVSGVLATMLAAAIVVGLVLVGELRAQSEHEAFKDCMARQGFAADAAPSGITDEAAVDEYLDEIAAADARCR